MSKCHPKKMLSCFFYIKQMGPTGNEFVSVQQIGNKNGFCMMTLHSGLKACSSIYSE
jgi:hypothetical protein